MITDILFQPGHTQEEYDSAITEWTESENPTTIGYLGQLLLNHLLYSLDTPIVQKDEHGTRFIDPHVAQAIPKRSRVEVAETVLQNCIGLERLFNKYEVVALHLSLFNIVVIAFQILHREEQIPGTGRTQKTSLRACNTSRRFQEKSYVGKGERNLQKYRASLRRSGQVSITQDSTGDSRKNTGM